MFTLDTIKMCYHMCLVPFSILTVLRIILMKFFFSSMILASCETLAFIHTLVYLESVPYAPLNWTL